MDPSKEKEVHSKKKKNQKLIKKPTYPVKKPHQCPPKPQNNKIPHMDKRILKFLGRKYGDHKREEQIMLNKFKVEYSIRSQKTSLMMEQLRWLQRLGHIKLAFRWIPIATGA